MQLKAVKVKGRVCPFDSSASSISTSIAFGSAGGGLYKVWNLGYYMSITSLWMNFCVPIVLEYVYPFLPKKWYNGNRKSECPQLQLKMVFVTRTRTYLPPYLSPYPSSRAFKHLKKWGKKKNQQVLLMCTY